MVERRGSFSIEDKQYVRDRANGHCEYGNGSCLRPNTNRVNHLTGCYEGQLVGMRPEDIANPKMNGTMDCDMHEAVHDAKEKLHVQQLLGERVIYERRIGDYPPRGKRANRLRVSKKRR